MAKKQIGFSFEPDVIDRLDQLAEQEGSSRQALVDRGIVLVLDGAKEDTKTLRLSVSQIQCLDQLAERAGMSRIDLMSRYLGERLRREFVDARNAKLQDVTRA
jgi:predicted transcriptional regulator